MQVDHKEDSTIQRREDSVLFLVVIFGLVYGQMGYQPLRMPAKSLKSGRQLHPVMNRRKERTTSLLTLTSARYSSKFLHEAAVQCFHDE
jgi:hypothetical protein